MFKSWFSSLSKSESCLSYRSMYLLFDCKKIYIFLLKNLGKASKMWQLIRLETDGSNKAVCWAESTYPLSNRTLVGFCLFRQGTKFCPEVFLQCADSQVLRQPACVLQLLKNISVVKIKASDWKYINAQQRPMLNVCISMISPLLLIPQGLRSLLLRSEQNKVAILIMALNRKYTEFIFILLNRHINIIYIMQNKYIKTKKFQKHLPLAVW